MKAQGPSKEILAELGYDLAHAKRFEEGEKILDRAVALGANDENTWCCLGNCRGRVGKLREGIEAYSKALIVEPRSVSALRGRAALYLCIPNLEAAFNDLDRLKKLPGYRDRSLADAYEDSIQYADNKIVQAKHWLNASKIESRYRCAVLDRAIAKCTNNDDKELLLFERSLQQLIGGYPKKALLDSERGLSLQKSDNLGLHVTHAAALEALERSAEAKAERRVIVELYSQSPLRRKELRKLFLGRTD